MTIFFHPPEATPGLPPRRGRGGTWRGSAGNAGGDRSVIYSGHAVVMLRFVSVNWLVLLGKMRG